MAVKINAGDNVKRGDLFFVDPFEVIVKENLRGRCRPVSVVAIVEMAYSLIIYGQRAPVECRRVDGNKIQLNLGFTRTNAARLIREGFLYEGDSYQDADFMLKVQISDCNDQTAFEANIVENAHRNDTSDVDDATNQQRLRDRYGYTDAEIARLYRYKSQGKVGRLRKLLQLDESILDMVHDDRLPTNGALALLDVPAEERQDQIAKLVNASRNGKVKGADVNAAVRARVLNDDNNDDGKSKRPKPQTPSTARGRSMREVKLFFQAWAECEDCPPLARFGKDALTWVRGKSTNKAMDNALDRLLEATK